MEGRGRLFNPLWMLGTQDETSCWCERSQIGSTRYHNYTSVQHSLAVVPWAETNRVEIPESPLPIGEEGQNV